MANQSIYWHGQQPYVQVQTTGSAFNTAQTLTVYPTYPPNQQYVQYRYVNSNPYIPPDPYDLAEGDVVFFKDGPQGQLFLNRDNNWQVLPDQPYRIKRVWTRCGGVDIEFEIETIDGQPVNGLYPHGEHLKKNDFLTAVDRAQREAKKEADKSLDTDPAVVA